MFVLRSTQNTQIHCVGRTYTNLSLIQLTCPQQLSHTISLPFLTTTNSLLYSANPCLFLTEPVKCVSLKHNDLPPDLHAKCHLSAACRFQCNYTVNSANYICSYVKHPPPVPCTNTFMSVSRPKST